MRKQVVQMHRNHFGVSQGADKVEVCDLHRRQTENAPAPKLLRTALDRRISCTEPSSSAIM